MLKKLLFYFIGMTLIGFGVGFILIANVGVGPWDLLMANSVKAFNISFTLGFAAQSAILITMGFILRKKWPDITVLLLLVTGLYIGFLVDVVTQNNDLVTNVVLGYLTLIGGLVTVLIGINIARVTNIILPSIDFFVESLSLRTGLTFGRTKQLMELVALIIGVAIAMIYDLPNLVWVGTIIILVTGGPIVNAIYPAVEKVMSKFNL